MRSHPARPTDPNYRLTPYWPMIYFNVQVLNMKIRRCGVSANGKTRGCNGVVPVAARAGIADVNVPALRRNVVAATAVKVVGGPRD
jgi:hypothetical protein